MSTPSLRDLVREARAGDSAAVASLIKGYASHIRRAARLRMRDPKLRVALDSSDICQSVFASFFARLALGQYDLERPGQLIRLLESMVRNKVATEARRLQVRRRELLSPSQLLAGQIDLADGQNGPSGLVDELDLIQAFHARMTAEERLISDRRAEGMAWDDIAVETGKHPDALRKRLTRALDRISRLLGLGDG
jgi:RNA polymerase sigma factor (sigma-70 family)